MDDRSQYAVKQNENGYTLLEMMISLSIFLTLTTFTPLMFSVLVSTDLKPIHQQEISLFFEEADKEIQGSIAASVRHGKLYLTLPVGDEVTYEKKDGRIVRKVNGTGFEILLQNIDGFEVALSQHTINLEIQVQGIDFAHKTVMIEPFVNQGEET